MNDCRRSHVRYNVFHLEFIELYIKNKTYFVIDLSGGGFSAHVEIDATHKFNEKTIFRKMELRLGPVVLVLDCEAVYFDKFNSICSFKIIKHYGGAKKQLASFLKNTKKGNLFTKIENENFCTIENIELSVFGTGWSLASPGFCVVSENGAFKLVKKPILANKQRLLLDLLGLVTGLPRDDWPVSLMVSDIVKEIRKR